MLNAEKFKAQLLKFVEENHDSLFGLDKNSEPISCTVSRCNNCQFGFKKSKYVEGYSCSAAKIKWLLSEYKEPVKLTRLEYDILKYLSDNTKHMYIVRDGNGDICLYDAEPKKSENGDWWVGRTVHGGMVMFNKLFQFVQWKDSTPTPIKDVLKNCEVVDDAEE